MNIFELPKYTWWEHMELLVENVNLTDISIIRNNCMIFTFSNSYNGKFYKSLRCEQILKCCMENEAYSNEEFAYFVPDVYVRELNEVEITSSLKYYKYGYNINLSKADKVYLLAINGNEICIDIICEKFELLSNEDKFILF